MQKKCLLILFSIVMIQANLSSQITEVFNQRYSQFNNGGGEFIIETPDGGYAITGTYYNDQTGEASHFLLRTDCAGNIQWSEEFWLYVHHWDCSVKLTHDSGFIVCSGGTDGQLARFDKSGNMIWDKSYGDEGYQFGRYGMQTSDSGYVFAGSYDSLLFEEGMDPKVWLVKTDQAGDTLWTTTFEEYGMGISVLQTADKSYLVTGEAEVEEAECSGFLLARTDSAGHPEWSKKWFPDGAWWSRPEDTKQTNDGGYITVGVTVERATQTTSAYIIKTEASGDTAWTRIIKKGAWSWAYSVQESADGKYIVAARTAATVITNPEGYKTADEIDVWIFALNYEGTIEWEETLGGPENDEVYCLHRNTDDSYIFTGGYGIAQWNYDPWLVKFTIDEYTGMNNTLSSQQNVQFIRSYPNPFHRETTISYNLHDACHVLLKIHNVTGQTVETLQDVYQMKGEHRISWRPHGLPGGIYFYTIQAGDFLVTKSIVHQK